MRFPDDDTLYVVRHYDGFDNDWIDVSDPVSLQEAALIWGEKTDGGKKLTQYSDIDYYGIFPADTVMRYSEEGRKEWEREGLSAS